MIDLFLRWAELPFEWGTTDCCQFVGACLEQRHGHNPAREFLYLGKRGASHLVDSYGGMAGLLTSVFGEPHADARDGDVALIDELQVVGYVHRDVVAVKTERGLTSMAPARSSRFWS